MTKYRQDRVTGKLHEVVSTVDRGHLLIKNFEPFVSPIDKKVISTRKQLLDHNKRHNVTQDPFKERMEERKAEQENLLGGRYKDPTRKGDIRDAIERCRGEGDNRYKYDD